MNALQEGDNIMKNCSIKGQTVTPYGLKETAHWHTITTTNLSVVGSGPI